MARTKSTRSVVCGKACSRQEQCQIICLCTPPRVTRKAFDDIGDPSEISGEFLSPQYVAYGVLHADTDYTTGTNAESQPVTLNFWPASQVHSHTRGDPEQTMYADLVKTLHHPNPENPQSVAESADEMWFQISASWQTVKSGVYFYHMEGWDLQGNPVGQTTGKFVVIR